MSTGGIALLLDGTPHKFAGLDVIGTVVFIFNIVLFLIFTTCIAARFIMNPIKFRHSLIHPNEGFFVGCWFLSIVTIISGIEVYGVPHCGPWLVVVVRVVFWIYAACSILFSTLSYYLLMTRTSSHLKLETMTPTWLLPVFASMLTGTAASFACRSQPPEQQLPILVAGIAYQGLGFLMSFGLIILLFGRLLYNNLPIPDQRPGLFMMVGSPGYTMVVLIGCADYIPENYAYFAKNPGAAVALKAVALFSSVWLWVLTFFLFLIAAWASLASAPREMGFKLSWWAFIFPNVCIALRKPYCSAANILQIGFTLATAEIGKNFESEGIQWVASAMTILVVAFWLFDFFLMIKAVITRRILWPQQDEDKDV